MWRYIDQSLQGSRRRHSHRGCCAQHRCGRTHHSLHHTPTPQLGEYDKGRTFDGPYGHYVQLDLRHLGEEIINKKLPFVRELASKYVGIDPVYEPIPVRPVVHYMMGGISTDINAKTTLEGLYA